MAGEGGQHRHPSNCLLSQKSKQLTVSGCLGIIREGRKLVSSVSVVSLTGGYLLCRLPEVSGVRQPAVQLGQLLQHVGQLGEGGPVPQVVGPAGGQDLLKGGDSQESAWRYGYGCGCGRTNTRSTHRHFLAQADLGQHLLHALSTPHLPDGGFHGLVGDGPVPGLQLIPNSA